MRTCVGRVGGFKRRHPYRPRKTKLVASLVNQLRQGTLDTETLLRVTLTLMLAVGSISIIEPSPYELLFFILLPITFFYHFVLTRVTFTLLLFTGFFCLAEWIALTPYFDDRPVLLDNEALGTPTLYTIESTYLFCSAVLFAIIFSRHTQARLRLALLAYTFSCLVAASWAIAAFLHVPGFSASHYDDHRFAGPFKDPNVLGSYCVLGAVYLIQRIMIGSPRMRLPNLLGLGIVLFGGIFLPFSRGAWGAMVFSALVLIVTTYFTADRKGMRRNILMSVAGVGILLGIGALYILADPDLANFLLGRAKLEQDYDGGSTGRFGNQRRAIPMLLERPLGFGPHRFLMYFDLDPHNSYIGAFSSAGWLGGFTFFLFVSLTTFIAIRLLFAPTPSRRQAQVFVPALLSVFLQGLQIDIDHWRFMFLMVGAVWGIEAARVRERVGVPAPRQPARAPLAPVGQA